MHSTLSSGRTRRAVRPAIAVVAVLLTTGGLGFAAAVGTSFRVDRDVVASGGGSAESSGFALRGTTGQAIVGDAAGPTFGVRSGRVEADADVATDAPVIPREHRLDQNRPNPFNPTTTIAFGLPEAARVELVLFDARGRRVRKLLDEARPAGEHRVVLDAADLSSGVYWYRLQAGSFAATRRMVLVK